MASLAATRFEERGVRVTPWTDLASVGAVALSRDGALLLGAIAGGDRVIVDTARLAPTVFLDKASESRRHFAEGAQFSPDGRSVAVLEQNAVVLYDTATGTRGKKLEWADQELRAFAFSPDGSAVFTGARAGFDAVVRRFDVATGDSTAEHVVAKGREVTALAVSPAGNLLAVATSGEALGLFDTQKLTRTKTLGSAPNAEAAVLLAFSPGGDRLAAASPTHLEIWSTAKGTALARTTLDRPWRRTILGFSSDGKRVRTSGGTWGETLVDYDPASGQALSSKKVPSGDQVLSPDASVVAISTRSGGLAIADAATGTVSATVVTRAARLEGLALADGQLALARRVNEPPNDHVEVFVIGARAVEPRFLSVPGYKATLAFSRLGQRLAGSFGGKSMLAWDVATGERLELPEAPEWVDELHFADPARLWGLGGPFERKLFVHTIGASSWSTELAIPRAKSGRAHALSETRAVTSSDDTVTVFDFDTQAARALPRPRDLGALGLSRDGKVLVLASAAGAETVSLPVGGPRNLMSGRCTRGPVSVSTDGSVVLMGCTYRDVALFSPAGTVTKNVSADRLELSPDGRVVVLEDDGRVSIGGRDLTTRVTLTLAARPGGILARAESGRLEVLGSPAAHERLFCRAGSRAYPFELCEDLVLEDDLVRDAVSGDFH
ncbi:MAG: WD40 repeat domain-containing protein [Polyangiaceae bacterium]|nr:WD40 repeat domain-containing protein [Polyangiaceae bacterium]